MILCMLFVLAGAVTLVMYVAEKLKGYSLKMVFLKTEASLCFLAVALSALWANRAAGGFGLLVTGGLILGLLGDIWLDLKYVDTARDELYTFAGFLSFALGHVLFSLGLLLAYAFPRPAYILAPLALAILAGVGNGLSGRLMGRDYGKFRLVTILYGAVLFFMTFLSGALALAQRGGCPTANLMFLGGVLFALSDLILGGTFFGHGHDRPADIIANYATYYPAQFLIALSLLFVR